MTIQAGACACHAPPMHRAPDLSPSLARETPQRERFRAYSLDGARLYFQPRSGVQVRVQTGATRALCRVAPRVVMFGITNACNLRCSFCSRGLHRESRWDLDSAALALEGLAEAGALEVAFGGGEPFAFPAFAALIARLHETTALAMHVTTNGALIHQGMWAPLRGLLGQVRISIYPEVRWQRAAEVLSAERQLWGANVLVDDDALSTLPERLAELAALGCHDVSLLSYVGAERGRQLSAPAQRRLAAIIEDAPLPARLSVCFGDRVPSPRLFLGADNDGDCGAGYDFVSVTADRRVQSCSFQDEDLPGATAAEILHAWRTRQATLSRPSPRSGCARTSLLHRAPPALPPITVWQAFSGNNSGECILVGKFDAVADAEAFVARLLPGWTPDEAPSAAWRQLFVEQGVAAQTMLEDDSALLAPQEMVAIGRSVLALSYAAGDSLSALRALGWKQGGYVVAGGVHVHDGTSVVAVIRCASTEDAQSLIAGAKLEWREARTYTHGQLALFVLPRDEQNPDESSLQHIKDLLSRLAGGRPLAVEISEAPVSHEALLAAKQRLGVELARRPRLCANFWGGDSTDAVNALAKALATTRSIVSGSTLLFDGVERRKRLAVLALRRGAHVTPLEGLEVDLTARLWFDTPPRQKGQPRKQTPPVVDPARLRAALGPPDQVEVEGPNPGAWSASTVARVRTRDPGRVMTSLSTQATALGCHLHVGIEDIDPLAWLLRRLIADTESA